MVPLVNDRPIGVVSEEGNSVMNNSMCRPNDTISPSSTPSLPRLLRLQISLQVENRCFLSSIISPRVLNASSSQEKITCITGSCTTPFSARYLFIFSPAHIIVNSSVSYAIYPKLLLVWNRGETFEAREHTHLSVRIFVFPNTHTTLTATTLTRSYAYALS